MPSRKKRPAEIRLEEAKALVKSIQDEINKANRKTALAERKKDNQRKYALGGALLALVESGEIEQSVYDLIVAYIDKNEKRNNIRALFSLEPITKPEQTEQAE